MKTRVKGNKIRLRLVQSEVKRLASGSAISEVTQIGPGLLFICTLVPSKAHLEFEVSLVGSEIMVCMPYAWAENWAENSVITYSAKIENGAPGGLAVVVEKDFVCLDHTDEDQSDNYPNPNKHC